MKKHDLKQPGLPVIMITQPALILASAFMWWPFLQTWPKNPFKPSRPSLPISLRLRERHLDYAAAHIQHMQKALTHMNLQLHHVVADITGLSGMRIIRAIVAGECSSPS